MLFGVYWLVSAAFGEVPARTATVTVEEGETLAEVADRLEEAGIVGSSTMFKLQARVEGGDADGRVVAVRQGNLMATSFHPEVDADRRIHQTFVDLVQQ